MFDYSKLGENIRKARISKGISQETLAELSGISLSHLRNIEGSKSRVTIGIVYDISVTVGLDLNTLAGDVRKPAEIDAVAKIEMIKTIINC